MCNIVLSWEEERGRGKEKGGSAREEGRKGWISPLGLLRDGPSQVICTCEQEAWGYPDPTLQEYGEGFKYCTAIVRTTRNRVNLLI